MTIQNAARSLQSHFGSRTWLVAVGVAKYSGRDTIVVYVTSLRHRELNAVRNGWEGFPVSIEKMGAIRPVEIA